MIIGITGSSGSGKSKAAKYLCELGFICIDFDAIAKDVACAGSPCLKEIVDSFENVLNSDGTLNRRTLGEIVWNNKEKLSTLNSITHKYILAEADRIISCTKGNILLDAPLLFEAELHKKCDFTVGIIADKKIQTERICTRDGISPETAEARLSKQHSNEFFINNCTYIIENNSTEDELKTKLKALVNGRCTP